jgi:AmmeMemoRadiSam system protein A
MSIPCAVLMCHAPIVLPQIAGAEAARCQVTTQAMHRAARALLAHEPDVIVLVSPHAPRARTRWGISHEENLDGSFARFGHGELALTFRGAPAAARALAAAAEGEGLTTHALPAQALDHGALVPLYFLHEASGFLQASHAADETRYTPRILLVALPHPGLSTRHEVSFGAAVRAAAQASGERWAVLASGDMSHRLTPDAPGGYDPRAREFDRLFVELVQRGDLRAAIALPPELVECAGQDCVQSTAVAAGAVRFAADGAHTFGYEGPFGVGYCEALIYSDRASSDGPPYRLVEVALAAIERSLRDERRLSAEPLAAPWDQPRAVFVTLRSPDGELRGCIGRTEPMFPTLVDEVIDCAIGAATRDPRMRSVSASELPTLALEVSVLAPAESIAGPDELDPARYGVIARQSARHGERRAVLLPGIAGIDTVTDQVRVVLHKAGIDPSLPYRLERFTVDKVIRKT